MITETFNGKIYEIVSSYDVTGERETFEFRFPDSYDYLVAISRLDSDTEGELLVNIPKHIDVKTLEDMIIYSRSRLIEDSLPETE